MREKQVQYYSQVAQESSAAGVTGLLCRSYDGKYFFQIRKSNGETEEFDLRHNDLKVTISEDELASFYRLADGHGVIDHSSGVLGLEVA